MMKRVAVIGSLMFVLALSLAAQTDQAFETRRKQALTLFDLGRQTEVMPLLEDLVKQKPDDMVLLERYAMCLLMNSATVQDVETRKQMRVKAKQMFARSKALGNDSQIVHLGDDIPDDGSFSAFSQRADVNAAIQAGEAAFAKGDYALAIENYQKAVVLDPMNYEAPLFIGDMYFRQGQTEQASTWFARAVAIDPNRETAYRYWGDALVREKKYQEAKEKFLAAIIAEPYNRSSWIGLINWADATGVKLVRANIQPPTKVEDGKNGSATITLSPSVADEKKDDGSAAWIVYPMVHLRWKNQGEFAKHYPAEKEYRHSLAEETEAFSLVLTVLHEQKKQPRNVDPQLAKLQELSEHGILDAYILIHRADEGIAQDYAAYRTAHRDKLQAYLESLIQPKDQ